MNRRSSSGELANGLQAALSRLPPGDPRFATEFVNAVLRAARDAAASDVHIDPLADGLEVRWRLDGVLQPLVRVEKSVAPNVIARLKVLASLLTYEMALPQEGRIWDEERRVEVRVSTFPTLYGERAVLRLLGASNQSFASLAQLGLPETVRDELTRQLGSTSGAILIVGPAGSGKTTTGYACLRHIVAQTHGGRSIASLEDPIEVAVDGVAQTQVDSPAGFDMARGLRNLLRLDPEVIFIGEIRDHATADVALQAALTGQLVVTTFHASNCDDAINRLIEIGIPHYALRNAIRLVVAQRLVRRLCGCSQPGDVHEHARSLGLNVDNCRIPGACDDCHQTGYAGRNLIADCRTTNQLFGGAAKRGDEPLWESATRLVEAGTTSPMEVVRVLGLRHDR
jgi:type II secretory ATPase GspE/PulE/Tfp pilus assembly ATPase PilB-like protein